jgi:hypothetical protein
MQLLTNGIFTLQQEEQIFHFIRLKGYIICQYYFIPSEGTSWQYKKCDNSKSKNGGWTNLLNHLKSCIGLDYEDQYERMRLSRGGNLNGYFHRMSNAEKEMHDWIELLVMKDLPLSFVDCPFVRLKSRLKSVSSKTVQKHMLTLSSIVQETIKQKLPQASWF